MIKWTDEIITALRTELAKRPVREAIDRIATMSGQPLTVDAVRNKFKRLGLGPLAEHTSDDPVAEHVARRADKRERSTIKDLVGRLEEARARQAFIDAAKAHKAPPRVMSRERTSGVREMTAVVLASDLHVEETVDPESVAYRNEYNLEIAARRLERLFQSVIWNVEHHRASGKIAIHDLVLWFGGDMMTGYIHEELIEGNALSPTETMLWLMPRLRDGIITLLDRLELASITIPCSYGNHGRTTAKPRIATGASNSFEWLMYHVLAERMSAESEVTFEITNSAHQYVDVYDRTMHFHHGDDVKYNGGVGGLGVPLLKAVPAWERIKPADVHCIGHHHTLLDYGRVVVNGSLIGYGPYSQRIRATIEPPQQAMFYMDSRRGKCMTTALWVDDRNDAEAAA